MTATDLNLEPEASFLCTGTSRTQQPGDAKVNGTGGGYASQGGGRKKYGPHRDKTCPQGFQKSKTQTSFLSYRDKLKN